MREHERRKTWSYLNLPASSSWCPSSMCRMIPLAMYLSSCRSVLTTTSSSHYFSRTILVLVSEEHRFCKIVSLFLVSLWSHFPPHFNPHFNPHLQKCCLLSVCFTWVSRLMFLHNTHGNYCCCLSCYASRQEHHPRTEWMSLTFNMTNNNHYTGKEDEDHKHNSQSLSLSVLSHVVIIDTTNTTTSGTLLFSRKLLSSCTKLTRNSSRSCIVIMKTPAFIVMTRQSLLLRIHIPSLSQPWWWLPVVYIFEQRHQWWQQNQRQHTRQWEHSWEIHTDTHDHDADDLTKRLPLTSHLQYSLNVSPQSLYQILSWASRIRMSTCNLLILSNPLTVSFCLVYSLFKKRDKTCHQILLRLICM